MSFKCVTCHLNIGINCNCQALVLYSSTCVCRQCVLYWAHPLKCDFCEEEIYNWDIHLDEDYPLIYLNAEIKCKKCQEVQVECNKNYMEL